MNSNKSNRGRKPKPFYFAAEKRYVVGLRKRPSDGRWELSDGRIFTEPDERKAVERAAKMLNVESDADYVARLMPTQLHVSRGQMVEWARKLILDTPQLGAKELGIEWLAYGSHLSPPEKLPTFDELEQTWLKHAKCSNEQRKKVAAAFKDFRKATAVVGVADVTPQTVIAYMDDVHNRVIAKKDGTRGTMSGKQQGHLFSGVRRVFSFAKSRALAVDAMTRVIGYLDLLKPSESGVTLDPKPIDVADWRKLYAAAADDAEDLAMLLLMLNGAFYIGEVIRLQWSDVRNGCIVTERAKTGKCVRVCVLWKQTIDALAKIERRGDFIFYNYRGEPLRVVGAQRRYGQVALKAGLAVERDGACGKTIVKCSVTASQLRDGAATAAAAANVNEKLCALLLGHRCGMSDHYVKRNPKMVAPAVDAVYAAYFAPVASASATAAATAAA